MAILGIDLGTTNSLASIWRNGKSALIPNSFGEYLTPSVISIDEDGTILVGRIAKERLVSHPTSSVASFKRHMGTTKKFDLNGKIFSAEDLSSLLLRRLKCDAEAFLGEPITEAIISVPAYFNDKQRSSTKRAGYLAGLHVERLVNEPSAAALACRIEDGSPERTYLVFDFGGGTLDVSLVECFDNVVEIVAISGDNNLGGDDFDTAIAEYFLESNNLDSNSLSPITKAILQEQAEKCKIVLSSHSASMMVLSSEENTWSIGLDRNKLIEISAPLFGRMAQPMKRVLHDSDTTLAQIDDIVLVGGCCKMPIVREYLSYLLGRKVRTVSPDRIVALGIGVCAGVKEREPDIRDLVLTDICPFTLGVAIYNRENPEEPIMSPLIERNSLLPCSKVDRFYTVTDNQENLRIKVFQGESLFCGENLALGEITITVSPAPQGREFVDVRFTYDINGIFEVEVSSESTGRTEKTVLVDKSTGMNAQEIEQRLSELSILKIHPRDEEENRAIVARGQRLFAETLGVIRKMVMQNIMWFNNILSTQDIRKIKHARQRLTNLFDTLEQGKLP